MVCGSAAEVNDRVLEVAPTQANGELLGTVPDMGEAGNFDEP